MKKIDGLQATVYCIVASLLLLSNKALAMGDDDPWLTMVQFHELQYLYEQSDDVIEWDADVWIGRDLSKFWLKTKGEYVDSDKESGIDSGNIELLYSHALTAFWDWKAGVRRDLKTTGNNDARNWLSFGFMGTAYNFWKVDTSLFIGDESSIQLRLELGRKYMITQKWLITPDVELVFNADNNQKHHEGSGLSEAEFSLQLGYQANRQLQPYIGISTKQAFGKTGDFRKAQGKESYNLSATIGIHFWF